MKAILLMGFLILAGFVLLGFQHNQRQEKNSIMEEDNRHLEKATFAGGCFWCMESDFEKVNGVVEAISGYSGGPEENPTYKDVSSGGTGHTEAVQVIYDPEKVSYRDLLDVFWRHVDPTDPSGQFVDRGSQYRTAIFYHDDNQKRLAVESKRELDNSGRFNKPIITEIVKLTAFYKAEDIIRTITKKVP